MQRKEIEVVAGILRRKIAKQPSIGATQTEYGEEFLAVKRGYGRWKGYWEFPGGKMEKGENAKETLNRELKEELEVEVEDVNFLSTIHYSYPDFDLTMHCFLCRMKGEDIILKEHEEMRWLEVGKLNTLNWLPADYQIFPLLINLPHKPL